MNFKPGDVVWDYSGDYSGENDGVRRVVLRVGGGRLSFEGGGDASTGDCTLAYRPPTGGPEPVPLPARLPPGYVLHETVPGDVVMCEHGADCCWRTLLENDPGDPTDAHPHTRLLRSAEHDRLRMMEPPRAPERLPRAACNLASHEELAGRVNVLESDKRELEVENSRLRREVERLGRRR